MQQSVFNVRVPLPDGSGVFLLNTLTDAQAILPAEAAALLDRVGRIDAAEMAALPADEREVVRELTDNGFIVEARARESEALEAHFRQVHESTDVMRVTVLTTLRCNFACDYCYQGDHNGNAECRMPNAEGENMSMESAARVGDWLEEQLDAVRPKKLSLLFFGGEPLLNLPVVYALAARASHAARERGIENEITIITNGLLLTREIVERLLPCGLAGIKVTLDGDRETHDRMRPLRGGQPTFDRIVRNIREIADLCPVSIGGNFDERSVDSYPALLEYLSAQEFSRHIARVSFKPIVRDKSRSRAPKGAIPLAVVDPLGKPLNGSTCSAMAGAGGGTACDACGLMDEKMSWLREETKRYGFATTDGVHMGPCDIHRKHAYTIGPDGSLYACPGFTGNKAQSTGHIDGRRDTARQRASSAFERLSAWTECRDCAFIPVCAGGCTVAAHAELGDINQPNCHKRSFEEGVAALAREAAATAFVPAPVS
ncbi:MAG TPA: radical SAM protein [Vicinamibacterales bacterium]|nr:radical SAM protein [Vicinamibacterales bacterium]